MASKHKSRGQKALEYEEKYAGIPLDYRERMSYLYDKLKIKDTQTFEIMQKRGQLISEMSYNDFNVILYEEPEGSPRPRFRLVNRKNLANMALANPTFVHVYSITGAEDNKYMRRLVETGELEQYNSLICTPCTIDICTYHKTPSSYNRTDTILAEIGIHRPIFKPDFDNLAKKYCDMFNSNIWLDDAMVVDGAVHKYYSILPRVEIRIQYLTALYNKYQYNAMIHRVDYDPSNPVSYYGQERMSL